MPSARLFIAVWPSADACADLALLPRKSRPGCKFVPEANWHVTIRFLGQADALEVAAALDEVRFESTTVRLGPMIDLLGDHSVVVHASGLDTLHDQVVRATSDLGDAPVRKRFVSHLTLARLNSRKHPAAIPDMVGAAFSTEFEASAVSLVESRLHPEGARYETLAEWPTVARNDYP